MRNKGISDCVSLAAKKNDKHRKIFFENPSCLSGGNTGELRSRNHTYAGFIPLREKRNEK